MGLFDRFGAGGGKLEIAPSALQVSPGQRLEGRVSFVSGSRAQQITNIKLKLNQSLTQMEQTPNGPQQRSHSQLVVPEITVSGPFTSEPGNRYDFPFQIQLPAQMVSTAPQICGYRLSVAADIDNEIDPGAGVDIQVVGGMMPQQGMGMPMAGGMPGQMPGMPGQMPGMAQPMMGGMQAPMMGGMQAPMMGAVAAAVMPGMMQGQMPGMPGAMPGMPQPMMGGMQPPMMGGMPGAAAPLGIGSQVLAQWQDGQFHPGRIVQMQNGYFAVDWDNPQLGQTTWVAQHQIQPSPMAQPMMGGMPGAMPGMPQPMMGGMPQPMAQAPISKQAHAPYAPGSMVYGQGPDGQFHPGRIVQSQNGYHAVDWDNAKLGPTVWLAESQIKPR